MEISNFVYILAAVFGYAIAQTAKFLISLRLDGFTIEDFFASGGMPSSHASLITSVATVIGLTESFDSAIFGLALAVLGVVMYDAVGVRRATGENTRVIEKLVKKVKIRDTNTIVHLSHGHTPFQTFMGVIVGILSGIFVYTVFYQT